VLAEIILPEERNVVVKNPEDQKKALRNTN
jgi:hypothetical protein